MHSQVDVCSTCTWEHTLQQNISPVSQQESKEHMTYCRSGRKWRSWYPNSGSTDNSLLVSIIANISKIWKANGNTEMCVTQGLMGIWCEPIGTAEICGNRIRNENETDCNVHEKEKDGTGTWQGEMKHKTSEQLLKWKSAIGISRLRWKDGICYLFFLADKIIIVIRC